MHTHIRIKEQSCVCVYSHCSSARSAEHGWHCWVSERAWILSPTSPKYTRAHTHTHTRQRRLLRHKQTLHRGIHERYKQPHYNKSVCLWLWGCVCVCQYNKGDSPKQRTKMIMSLHEIKTGRDREMGEKGRRKGGRKMKRKTERDKGNKKWDKENEKR